MVNGTWLAAKPTKRLITTHFPSPCSTPGDVSTFSFLIIPSSHRPPTAQPQQSHTSNIILPRKLSEIIRIIIITLHLSFNGASIFIILPKAFLAIGSNLDTLTSYLVYASCAGLCKTSHLRLAVLSLFRTARILKCIINYFFYIIVSKFTDGIGPLKSSVGLVQTFS
jgi:hypothetical protein